MSTENDEQFDETDEQTEGNATKTLRKQNSKLTKDLDELKAQLAKFQEKERSGQIATLLTEHGANTKLAKFVKIDGDVSSESVLSWLTDNGDAFGWEPAEAGEDDEEVQVQRQSARRISNASAQAPAGNKPLTVDAMQSMSIDQLIAAGIINR